jgi:hypothetical protein
MGSCNVGLVAMVQTAFGMDVIILIGCAAQGIVLQDVYTLVTKWVVHGDRDVIPDLSCVVATA